MRKSKYALPQGKESRSTGEMRTGGLAEWTSEGKRKADAQKGIPAAQFREYVRRSMRSVSKATT